MSLGKRILPLPVALVTLAAAGELRELDEGEEPIRRVRMRRQVGLRKKEPGCRQAACRTLKDCLCTCKRCVVECVDRKVVNPG